VLRAIRIDNATRSLHTECPLYAADFVIGSVGLSSQAVCADTPVTLGVSARRRTLRACHHARIRCPGVNPLPPDRARERSRARQPGEYPSQGPEAADSLVNPAWILALRRFGTINAAHARLAPPKTPPASAAAGRRLRDGVRQAP
jgi:hypothetical protein